MLISTILKNTAVDNYELQKEQPFETLALCETKIDKTFCTFVSSKNYIDKVSDHAVMIITTKELAKSPVFQDKGLLITENPRVFFFKLHNLLTTDREYMRKTFASRISDRAEVSPLAYISEKNVIIEDHVVIEPFVTIYPNVTVKSGSVIRSGCRIGGEGFEFKKDQNTILSVVHAGGVIIGNHTEIQNNSCIDKALYPWDDTVLEDEVKVDDLVYIAHGVKIQSQTLLAAQSGIGGRTIIGKNVWVGLGASIRNGICAGNDSCIHMGAAVTTSLSDHASVSGNFAVSHDAFLQHIKKLAKEE